MCAATCVTTCVISTCVIMHSATHLCYGTNMCCYIFNDCVTASLTGHVYIYVSVYLQVQVNYIALARKRKGHKCDRVMDSWDSSCCNQLTECQISSHTDATLTSSTHASSTLRVNGCPGDATLPIPVPAISCQPLPTLWYCYPSLLRINIQRISKLCSF